MTYQGYTNFSEFTADKVETVTTLGFDIVGFIGRHPLLTALFFIILFGLYKFFVEPILIDEKEMDLDLGEDEE